MRLIQTTKGLAMYLKRRTPVTGRARSPASALCTVAQVTVLTAVSVTAAGEEAGGSDAQVMKTIRAEAEQLQTEYAPPETRTATKTNTALRDVPQSVSVVTSDLIEDLDMRSMADVVRYVPGVTMGQGEGHRDAPTLRGNATTADFFVDGVRDDVQYFRDLYNAERIEVLKGPNAMIFGRGGGGGVINRVTKQADGQHHAAFTLEGGSHDSKRIAGDIGEGFGERVSLRLNAMYEDSDSYRDFVGIERYGINPTAWFVLSDRTQIRVGFEHFNDERTVDRGVPSFQGRPLAVDDSVFFGNPDLSYSEATVNLANVTIEHAFSPDVQLRNHTLYGDYDKFYQNVFPNSTVNAGNVTLSAYHSGTDRQNLFNQTDLTWQVHTGAVEHTILAGLEFGWQDTENLRNNSSFAQVVPITDPVTRAAVSFNVPNQNNDVDVTVQSVYLQDQLQLSERFQLIAGLRLDRFDIEFDNRLNGQRFERDDDLVSPRAGLIYKLTEPVSLYASYSVSFLPSSGDQFASLTASTAAFEPEEFENIEVGVKWDLRPDLALTAAIYQLDRTNTTAPDPAAGTTVLTGAQRSEGVEVGLSGAVTDRWSIVASYAYQEAEITRTTSAAPEGTEVPLVPQHQFALWNRYRFTPGWGAGIGATSLSDMYASISNAVTLPSFTRVDAAVFFTPSERFEARLNIENLLDETYWWTAHNDNNITPGSPTAFRLGATMRF